MILDIVLAVVLVLALIKGFQQGLIAGLFSFIGIIIGLAAAIKLSAVVAGYIGNTTKVSEQWLPIISFAVVFILVVLLVRWIAGIIQRSFEFAMLGWVNRLGGMVFYAAIYIAVFSVVLFYAEQIELIRPETTAKSVSYPLVQPIGPKTIDGIGSAVPAFKDMFADLKDFFGSVSDKLSRR